MLETTVAPSQADTTIYLKDYQRPNFAIPKVELEFELIEKIATITSRLTVVRQKEDVEPLVLNGEKLDLRSIQLNGEELSEDCYEITDDFLTIHCSESEFELVIVTRAEPHLNTELSGLYQSSGNFCTQCEAEGFRRITYFLDRPDVLSQYTVTITADKVACPVLLSNGNLIDSGKHYDGRHWVKWHDPHPKPSYLFALVAGDLEFVTDTFTTMNGEQIELNIYTQKHNIELCDHAMESLKNSMRWDEEKYGREYDLSVYNIVAVDDFNMGAMENKGLNVFNSKYVLADQQTATDSDFEGVESVIGHEYFHNWSGNRVTCRDWFQLSLKEGFTVFRDQEFSADMGSRAVKRIRDVQILRAYQFKEDSGPMAHPVRPDSYQEINNFYTVTIYNKGAEVIRMMHSLLGAKSFRKGTDLYFDTFDGQAVTTEDFVQSMEKASGVDLTQFRLWYTQSGTPEVTAGVEYSDGKLSLTLRQNCPETPGQANKKPFLIPLKLALFSEQGEKILSDTLSLSEENQLFEFDGLSSKPAISILRDFSAPIRLNLKQDEKALKTLIRYDDNGYSRWEAMQELSLNLILPAIESGKIEEQKYQTLLSAMKELIISMPEDKAILAEMLTLPTSAYIAELVDVVQPQTIANVRKTLVAQLARDLESQFHMIYATHNQRDEFSLSAEAMAERSLKNRALSYLVASDQAAYHALASHQYHQASNMTDRLAAFTALAHSSYPEKDLLVQDFYESWHDHALVLDKWLAIQAMQPSNEAVKRVEDLVSHSSFSINNPNKVRALIGSFCANLEGFHVASGSGYKFVADKVIELNGINPQVAARIVGVFNKWRSFTSPHRDLMQEQLIRISNTTGLTKDVSEIVNKALENN
ncbi:MAG: aminopeptidase N [Gammaproteobacteria bacterium]|nr:aminopeptidase N [Gammaproteobacteria bacterium]